MVLNDSLMTHSQRELYQRYRNARAIATGGAVNNDTSTVVQAIEKNSPSVHLSFVEEIVNWGQHIFHRAVARRNLFHCAIHSQWITGFGLKQT